MMDGQMDLLSHTLTIRGGHVASWLNSAQWFRRQCDGQMDGCRTERKIMLLSHTLIMRGSDVASLVEFRSEFGRDSMMDRWADNRCMEKICCSCTALP